MPAWREARKTTGRGDPVSAGGIGHDENVRCCRNHRITVALATRLSAGLNAMCSIAAKTLGGARLAAAFHTHPADPGMTRGKSEQPCHCLRKPRGLHNGLWRRPPFSFVADQKPETQPGLRAQHPCVVTHTQSQCAMMSYHRQLHTSVLFGTLGNIPCSRSVRARRHGWFFIRNLKTAYGGGIGGARDSSTLAHVSIS